MIEPNHMHIIGALIIFVIGVFLLACLFAIPTWALWNWLMSTLFELKRVTLFQAWGLLVLCSILFKSSNTSSSEDED